MCSGVFALPAPAREASGRVGVRACGRAPAFREGFPFGIPIFRGVSVYRGWKIHRSITVLRFLRRVSISIRIGTLSSTYSPHYFPMP